MSGRPLDWRYFSDRLNAADALAFLEKELGKGFFKTCGRNHPVQRKLMMAGGEGQNAELVKWERHPHGYH